MFTVGVSSGIFGAAAEAERMQYAGLSRKAQYCITKGVEFVQIDLESVSEFKEPDLKKSMEKVKQMNVSFGIHSETRAFGVEAAELDSAIETDYKLGHERLFEILNKSGEIGSNYVLIHSSESEPFPILERTLQPSYLVDYSGRGFRDFLNLKENQHLIDWVLGGKVEEIPEKIFEKWKEKKKELKEEDLKEIVKSQDFIWREVIGVSLPDAIRRRIEDIVESLEMERGESLEKLPEDVVEKFFYPRIKRRIEISVHDFRDGFLDYLQSRSLHYGPERTAYFITAKWMEDQHDPLWHNIVESTIEYFAKSTGMTKEEWLRKEGIEKKSIDDANFRDRTYLWVPAVSAKYIYGHLTTEKYSDFKKTIKEHKMPLILETPMAGRGREEWLRLPNPIQMYWLAKEVNTQAGFECLGIAMDFEHMLSIKLDPELVIDCMPEDGGKFVRVIHAGWPSPLAPAHIPIPIGSEQQLYLYKLLFKLAKKGFGKGEENFYIVFERGGGPDPIQQSIIALREIVKYLEKDVPPEKLGPEFYGVETKGFLSPERQKAIISEHALDPLKGLIIAPEEEYTFLGKAATEKGAPEKWKKEELK